MKPRASEDAVEESEGSGEGTSPPPPGRCSRHGHVHWVSSDNAVRHLVPRSLGGCAAGH